MPKREAKWSEPKPEAKKCINFGFVRWGIFQNFTHCAIVEQWHHICQWSAAQCPTAPTHNTHSARTHHPKP